MKNNTSRIADFSQLVENLKETGNKKNVAVVWAEDSHTLEAVEMAYEAGFANPILVCSQQTAEKYEGKYEILLADNPQDASEKAVALVREGCADALMKGFVNTDVLLRAILDKEKGLLPKGKVLTQRQRADTHNGSQTAHLSETFVLHRPRRHSASYAGTAYGTDTIRYRFLPRVPHRAA